MSHENENNQPLISELSDRLLNGIVKENPTFVLLLGMCPTLAVTTSAINGLGMGVTTMIVLALSNLFISLLRNIIPNKIRIPAFIVIIASFVTIVELLLEGYIPVLYDALGLYIPLIVVNCIILGRAESYAYSHKALPSLFDGIGMGMGFTFALTLIGAFRELLGSGMIFAHRVMPAGYVPVSIFIMAPGAFFVLAMLTAIQNVVKDIGTKKGKDMSKIQSGCGGNCLECTKECKVEIVNESVTISDADVQYESKTTENAENSIASIDNANEEFAAKEENVNIEEATAKEETLIEEVVTKAPSTDVNLSENVVDGVDTNDTKADDVFEILDISLMNSDSKAPVVAKKPRVRRASLEKAQAMLSKAEESLKEEKND